MSDGWTGHIDEKPRRVWADETQMSCYLGMKGRVTLQELVEHFAVKYPDVNPLDLNLNFATVTWEEPPTPDDLAKRESWRAHQKKRTAVWEQATYERLKKIAETTGWPTDEQ